MQAKDKVRAYIHPKTHVLAKKAALEKGQTLHEFLDKAIPLGIGLMDALESNRAAEFIASLQERAA